jgi:hypothetical protein
MTCLSRKVTLYHVTLSGSVGSVSPVGSHWVKQSNSNSKVHLTFIINFHSQIWMQKHTVPFCLTWQSRVTKDGYITFPHQRSSNSWTKNSNSQSERTFWNWASLPKCLLKFKLLILHTCTSPMMRFGIHDQVTQSYIGYLHIRHLPPFSSPSSFPWYQSSTCSRMENREEPDSESGSFRSERPGEGKLVRQLKKRHVTMIRYANLSLHHS